jgi:hypothetical protein
VGNEHESPDAAAVRRLTEAGARLATPTAPGQKSAAELRERYFNHHYCTPWEGSILHMALDSLESSERREAELRAFKDTVIDALVCTCIYEAAHETDPRKALNDLLVWEGNVALDPKVSKAARELIERSTEPLNATIASQAARIAGLEADARRHQNWINDLQSDMYVNCVYCGHRYGPQESTPATMAVVLKEHIAQCPQHPMSALKEAFRTLLGHCEIAAVMPTAIGKTLDMSMDSEPLRAARAALAATTETKS